MRIEGRKKLTGDDIEAKAGQLLSHYNPTMLEFVRPTPLLDIVSFLEEKHGLEFHFDMFLGFSEKGERILGAFNPKKKIILVDASLKADEYKFNFTLAHELGHLALHRSLKIILDDNEAEVPSETINERIDSNKSERTEADWLEWQANYYASALLMPKDTFKAALILSQQKIGVSRVGKIFIDDQPANQVDYHRLVTMLSDFFRVSRTAVDIRLKKLGFVDDRRNGGAIRNIMNDLGF